MNNFDKVFSYLKPILKKKITVDGKDIEPSLKHLHLSEFYFKSDGCVSCGRCCKPWDNLYTESEYKRIMSITKEEVEDYGLDFFRIEELREDLDCEEHVVNGKTIKLYLYKNKGKELYIDCRKETREVCNWQFKKEGKYLCGIHPVRSITCRMPHMRVIAGQAKPFRTSSVSIAQYGRNYLLGCPISLDLPKDEEEFEKNKKESRNKLLGLKKIADDLNVETYIPEILEYAEKCTFEDYKKYAHKDIVSVQ